MPRDNAEALLVPSFEHAYWRSEERRRFRDFAGFSKKKGHSEPDEPADSASRWAAELAREESAEEIRRIYENAVVICGHRRSEMERTETSLACGTFDFQVKATQDEENPAQVRLTRELHVRTPLNELPAVFDDLFPFAPDELVVPVSGELERRAVLVTLEDWEHALRARLSENAGQDEYKLRLPTGFILRVDLRRRETVFEHEGVSGVLKLGASVALGLKEFGIRKRLA